MALETGDLWSEIIAAEEDNPVDILDRKQLNSKENRLRLAHLRRSSRNRSLSTRGRTSVVVAACVDDQPHQQRKSKRDKKPPRPRGKNIQLPNFNKEIAYFQEVDSFELLEESPSPKKCTWIMGVQPDKIVIPHLSSVLQKWLISQRRKRSCGSLPFMARILETPSLVKNSLGVKTFQKPSPSIQTRISFDLVSEDSSSKFTSHARDEEFHILGEESSEDIETAVSKLSLDPTSSLDGQSWDPFSALLTACEQSAPSTLLDVLATYSDPKTITKVGEGTYGEAFKVGKTVCKIVPFDGDFLVNGEVQKRSEELLEEVMLSRTLNHLRCCEDHVSNACNSFIQTIDLRVCQGPYDAALIKAWEDWDRKLGSENDHPEEFPTNQCYVVFVQEHGGKDLESFTLNDFDEARSLLIQVTLALAVAEAAYEFEHRDLHWGNILLSRKGPKTICFTLEGRKMYIRTYGLSVSVIDFTLSRLQTGDGILFLDLSSDPEIFEGPKGDTQFDTYRKMKEVTDDYWEGSFPKTNVLWLQYLVDILLTKKSYRKTTHDDRSLRSLKKSLNSYDSAKEAIADPFFSDLFANHEP